MLPPLSDVGDVDAMLSEILLDDVIQEILSRIPAKILLRFRAVSKSWRTLMANPQFIAKHHRTRAAKSSNGCILLELEPEPDELEADDRESEWKNASPAFVYFNQSPITWETPLHLETIRNGGWIAIFSPCNGIVCMALNRFDVLLWNPAIRQVMALPQSHILDFEPPLNFISSYEPILGLCFDPKSNCYMVVRIWRFNSVVDQCSDLTPEFLNIVEVWKPGDLCWRQIDVVPPVPLIGSLTSETINLKGRCYWRAVADESELVSFDMADEVFRAISLPDANSVPVITTYGTPFWAGAVVLKESIALISLPLQQNVNCFEVWLMKESMDGRQISWSKHMTVETPLPDMIPLGFWKNGEVILQSNGGDLVFFNTSTGETINTELQVYNGQQVYIYDESLVSIKGFGANDALTTHLSINKDI